MRQEYFEKEIKIIIESKNENIGYSVTTRKVTEEYALSQMKERTV